MKKITFSDRKQFLVATVKHHIVLLGMWLTFILFGSFFAYMGSKVEDNSLGFIIFGFAFIILSSAFMLFTLPSSFLYYYSQAKIKKYGAYSFAKITKKRVDDYSHKTSSFNGGRSKKIASFLYVVEFEFIYQNKIYSSECFFEHQSTFDAISLDTELPIKFLKTNPNNVTLRRRKLSNQLGIPEKMCH